jgi:hypothetical protein
MTPLLRRVADGEAKLVRQPHQHTTLGGAVELGEDQPGDRSGLGEDPGLRDGVLPRIRVEHEQRLVGSVWEGPADHTNDLAQLLDERLARLQTPGGVDQSHVDVPSGGGLEGVEGHSGRVAARAPPHDLAADTLPPGLELLERGSAKGVAGAEDHRAARLAVVSRELAEGGGLPRAVDAEHEHHVGRAPVRHAFGRQLHGAQLGRHRVAQHLAHARGIPAAGLLAYSLEQALGGAHPEIRAEQQRLELAEHLALDAAARDQLLDATYEGLLRAHEPLAETDGTRRGRLDLGLRLDGDRGRRCGRLRRLGGSRRLRRSPGLGLGESTRAPAPYAADDQAHDEHQGRHADGNSGLDRMRLDQQPQGLQLFPQGR